MRLAEPFERLRDASDRMLAERGARPKVFLANLGTPAEFAPRASFAQNLFEAGGIEAVTNDGFADINALASAFSSSGAALVCLCSSDQTYAGDAAPAARALKTAGAARIYLAGRPRNQTDALARAGIDAFVTADSDALAILHDAHAALGITPL
jgi:methylmalonyl-CoA mutase